MKDIYYSTNPSLLPMQAAFLQSTASIVANAVESTLWVGQHPILLLLEVGPVPCVSQLY